MVHQAFHFKFVSRAHSTFEKLMRPDITLRHPSLFATVFARSSLAQQDGALC